MLEDRGLLVHGPSGWQLAEDDELPLPETVQGMIAARLDALAPAEKELIQDAAVVGKVFWPARSLRSAAFRARRSSNRCTRSSARSSCAGSGAPPSRASCSTRSCTCSSATSRTARSRARAGSRSIRAPRRGSSRSHPTATRITPRCSRTTTEKRSRSQRQPASTHEPLRGPARTALADASERAASLNAWAAAEELAGAALELDVQRRPAAAAPPAAHRAREDVQGPAGRGPRGGGPRRLPRARRVRACGRERGAPLVGVVVARRRRGLEPARGPRARARS